MGGAGASNGGTVFSRASMFSRSQINLSPVGDSRKIAAELRDFVACADFPCVGAKAALRRHQLEILVACDIRSSLADEMIVNRLQNFAIRHDGNNKLFVSQAIVFSNDIELSEGQFETYLWQRLTALHTIDKRDYLWDPTVDSDPKSPHFSMSIGGKGFFIVGLHPNASRAARRFKYPTMVFNLHAQFERLRDEGRYEAIRNKTIERDVALDGSANPMLARHGEAPPAAQYSGRHVGADWKCPFKHG
jgi:FPC/CPF motif-containing protein YcgG